MPSPPPPPPAPAPAPATDGPATDTEIPRLRTTLTDESAPLSLRFRALFALKHHATSTSTPTSPPPSSSAAAAVEAMAAAFASPSALLKHEVAYCLGQTGQAGMAAPVLRGVLLDAGEDAMCRHEAAEALGALGDAGSVGLLRERRDDAGEVGVVRETCEVAVARIEWLARGKEGEEIRESDFASIDPAPPLPLSTTTTTTPSIRQLQDTLLDDSLPLFHRYRAMFALRDLASPPDLPTATPAVEALARGLADRSALFRHEIAFVFGQLSHPASIPSLVATLSDRKEESMVRHEAAEALGSLGSEEGVEEVLRRFIDDPEQVVRESIIVALDMAEFEKTGESEYATVPGLAEPVALAAA